MTNSGRPGTRVLRLLVALVPLVLIGWLVSLLGVAWWIIAVAAVIGFFVIVFES